MVCRGVADEVVELRGCSVPEDIHVEKAEAVLRLRVVGRTEDGEVTHQPRVAPRACCVLAEAAEGLRVVLDERAFPLREFVTLKVLERPGVLLRGVVPDLSQGKGGSYRGDHDTRCGR